MSHLVTASLKGGVTIRKESVPMNMERTIGSGFSGIIQGEKKEFFFTENGLDQVDLVINQVRSFDLDNKVDKHNWLTLSAFLHLNPEERSSILMIDPQAETDKANLKSKRAYKVESFIRDNEEDKVFLAQIYRRLIGFASGITEKVIFKELIDLAQKRPELFLNKQGELTVQSEDWEMYALLDTAIEKGVFLKDAEGRIRKDKNSIYATDVESAVFQLKTDAETRIYLQRGIEGRVPSKVIEPIIEDSDFVNLISSVAVVSDTKANLVSDLDLSVEEESVETTGENITKMVASGVILKTGAGPSTSYTIEGLDMSFNKKTLTSYFQQNKSQYIHLKKQAQIQ